MVDFASITKMEDPVQVLEDNWLICVPKIFQKVKVGSQTHKKTYLPFLPVISECSEKSAEDICERKPHIFIEYHDQHYYTQTQIYWLFSYAYVNYFKVKCLRANQNF